MTEEDIRACLAFAADCGHRTDGGSGMRELAYRRHQLQRAKGRAFHYLRWRFGPRAITGKQIARYTADRTPCSCSLCGNPRRITGAVTVQEMRSGGSR